MPKVFPHNPEPRVLDVIEACKPITSRSRHRCGRCPLAAACLTENYTICLMTCTTCGQQELFLAKRGEGGGWLKKKRSISTARAEVIAYVCVCNQVHGFGRTCYACTKEGLETKMKEQKEFFDGENQAEKKG